MKNLFYIYAFLCISLMITSCNKEKATISSIVSGSTSSTRLPQKGAYYACIASGCAGDECKKNPAEQCNVYLCRPIVVCFTAPGKMSETEKLTAAKKFTDQLKEEKLITTNAEYKIAFEFTKGVISSNY